MSKISSSHLSKAVAPLLEQLEQRLLLAVDPYSGMVIGAGLTEFNAGTFIIDDSITITSGATVRGAGQGETIIQLIDNDPNGVNVFRIASSSNVTVSDLTVEGRATTQPAWTYGGTRHWEGFYITNSSYVTLQDITVQNMVDNGVIFEGGGQSENHIYDSSFITNGFSITPHGVNGRHDGSGVWLTGTTNASIERSYAEGNGYHGLGIGGVSDNGVIRDSVAIDNMHVGFAIMGSVYNSVIENNVGYGNVYGASTAGDPGVPNENTHNTIRNNQLYDSVQSGIQVVGNASAREYASVVENNLIDGVGAYRTAVPAYMAASGNIRS